VKAAGERLLQALAQSGTARANQGRALSVNTGISNSRTSANTSQGLALGNRSISGNNYSVGGSLSYEVDCWAACAAWSKPRTRRRWRRRRTATACC
jgi:multidrug efflux system outer membrane protein